MKNKAEIEQLEKLIGQLQGLHSETTALAKKSPNDAVHAFKLKMINKAIESGNAVLGDKYRPIEDFDGFNADDVPSTSDVTMVLAQYMEEAERYRSDNIRPYPGGWGYVINNEPSGIRTGPPSKVRK
jgi:hypothetical protein